MQTKKLILKVVSCLFGVLAFLSMLFPFVLTMTTLYTGDVSTHKQSIDSFLEWVEVLSLKLDNLWVWQMSYVIMIILLALIGVTMVLLIVQTLLNNKILATILKWTTIVSIIVAVMFIVTFVVGCVLRFGSTEYSSWAVFPHAGPVVMAVSAITSFSFALKS